MAALLGRLRTAALVLADDVDRPPPRGERGKKASRVVVVGRPLGPGGDASRQGRSFGGGPRVPNKESSHSGAQQRPDDGSPR
ncbi:hypothetical protein MTO96_013892 [Rhipicephalus appendiculatus]